MYLAPGSAIDIPSSLAVMFNYEHRLGSKKQTVVPVVKAIEALSEEIRYRGQAA